MEGIVATGGWSAERHTRERSRDSGSEHGGPKTREKEGPRSRAVRTGQSENWGSGVGIDSASKKDGQCVDWWDRRGARMGHVASVSSGAGGGVRGR